MNGIKRTTNVISISLPPSTANKLERARKQYGQSRSAYISSLIDQKTEEDRWKQIYAWGEETRREFGIESEDDIDRIIHEA